MKEKNPSNIIKILYRSLLYTIVFLLSFIAFYIIASVILTLIPVNTSFQEPEKGIDIYVESNGVHTDLVVPVKTPITDWSKKIDPEKFKSFPANYEYISFGWGDKGFYLHTPTWREIKFETAFVALFYLGTSAVHVTYQTSQPELNEKTVKVTLTQKQYVKLVEYIDNTFRKDSQGNYDLIVCCPYGENDNFYEAIGKYHFFQTCNSWTNKGLKYAGVKTAFWAPFEWNVFYHLKNV